eukprot:CAMPEP_0185544548 /NCGR_PEP_ID=MMETSP1381-20130426/4148_1 /TAXON_ID=298111 /ORGANISM="Pavlova sp., Strain CCMP459" /LENGTH=53 /DNA_ID=CAMNT_0028156781 /DNA_START=299 /DNA_END=456 /DNA_ORIENTATION=-
MISSPLTSDVFTLNRECVNITAVSKLNVSSNARWIDRAYRGRTAVAPAGRDDG